MGELILGLYDSDEYFVVTTDGILEPLGVQLVGDGRNDLMPRTRDIAVQIPGRDGDLDLGVNFENRVMELHVVTEDGLTAAQKCIRRREMAKYLNPKLGYKKLLFMDDPTVYYEVRYAGQIELREYPSFIDFTIPFKTKPFIYSMVEKGLSGNGTATNDGTVDCPLTILVTGPATVPTTVEIGGYALRVSQDIGEGEVVTIDTEKMTAKVGIGVNILNNYIGDFPVLVPGTNAITTDKGSISIKWRERFI